MINGLTDDAKVIKTDAGDVALVTNPETSHYHFDVVSAKGEKRSFDWFARRDQQSRTVNDALGKAEDEILHAFWEMQRQG